MDPARRATDPQPPGPSLPSGLPGPSGLPVLERYYDAAPRPVCRTEEVGPFTLFVRDRGDGWPFYARRGWE